MKIHKDPTPEFAHLAQTKWQRYVIYRLESAAGISPWGPATLIAIMTFAMFMAPISTRSIGNWPISLWYPYGIIAIFGLLRIVEIHFSRAVLLMLRGQYTNRYKEDQQAAPSNR
jgi:hypothetical protein